MTRYVALVDGKPGSYGLTVPDLPGCTSAAATTDEVSHRATEAVRLWAEDARLPMVRNYLSRARSRRCAPIPKWRRRLPRAPLWRSYRSSSMRAGRPRQTSRSTPACSQPSTRQPLRADLRARPSWRALRARRSKARADRIRELRPPAISHPGLSERCPSADWRSQVYTLSYTKQKGEPAKRGYSDLAWASGRRWARGLLRGGWEGHILHDGCLSQE
jgi:predicted RNase H-like HicB family nuclease